MLGLTQILLAQKLTVLSSESSEPLELVTILSQEPKAMALTNARGEADIKSMVGSPDMEIRLMGYKAVRLSYAEIESKNFMISLDQSNISLQQVNISGTRWRQPSRENPERIISISPKEVELQSPQTAADLLGTSGEVYIQKSQLGGGSPIIRGFSTKRLLYTVDGVRMNNAIFRGGNLQNVISLDAFAIENTEVLFGPGSVIYGSDAIGAVMSFHTLEPQFSLNGDPLITGKAVTRYSSASDEKTAHFDVNVGWKKWAMVTSFTSSDYGDLIMGSHGPDSYLKPFYVKRIDGIDVAVTNENPLKQVSTGYSQINLMQKVSFKPNDDWEFDYGFHYSETGDIPRYDRLVRTKKGLPKHSEWYYGPQKWMLNNLSVSYNNKTAAFDQVNLRLAHQYFEESRVSRNFNKPNKSLNVEQVNAVSVNADFLKNFTAKTRMFYGLEYVQNDVVSTGEVKNIETGEFTPAGSRYPGSSFWNSYAAYATFQTDLTSKLVLQTGARYNGYGLEADFTNNLDFYPLPVSKSELNNAALTGSLGFTYRPEETWAISVNGSSGFRAPNVDDVGKVFDSEPGSVIVPNTDLQAEYAYNAEVGVAKVFGDVMKIDLTGYYTWLENAMVRRDFILAGRDSIIYQGEMSKVQAIQNAAIARIYGIQAGLEVKLPAGFSISSRFNYQVGEEELDNGDKSPSRHAAPIFGVSRLTYSANKLSLQFYATYAGAVKPEDLPLSERKKDDVYEMDIDGKLYSPSWYTINLKAMYALNKTFTVSAGLENITDQRYRPYGSGLVAPGKNMILSLRANF